MNMNAKRVCRCAAVALCVLMAACGSRSTSAQRNDREQLRPETAASVAPPTASRKPQAPESGLKLEASDVRLLSDAVRKAFPAARSSRSVSQPFPHRVVADSSGRVLGYEVFSDSADVTGRGYAGMVPVQVLLNAAARPVRVYVLDNCETPAYLDIALGGGLLERLLTYDPAKPDTIDAVTLATSSSRAVIAGVTGIAKRVSSEISHP